MPAERLRALASGKLPSCGAALCGELPERHDPLGAVDDPVVAVRVAAEPHRPSIGDLRFGFDPLEQR